MRGRERENELEIGGEGEVEIFPFNLFTSTFYEKEEDLGQQFLPPFF